MASPFSNKICTLIDLLEQRAGERPDQTLYTFLQDGETEAGHLSFRQLQEKARGLAGLLQEKGYGGERVLLLFPPGLDFIAALFACFYAKVTAVPVYPPDPMRLDRTLPRLKGIVRDAQAKGVLTLSWVQALAPQLEDVSAGRGALGNLEWISIDQVKEPVPWKRPDLDEEDLAFLQYTSGSTGEPKGVMVSHGNLLHNLEIIRQCFGLNETSRGLSWLPPYHDMGLIGGILEPLYIGGFTVLFSPIDFLKQPYRWLSAITRYRATTCGGPNFAYELCIRKISEAQKAVLDLSSWDLAFNGAEPIRAATLDRFANAFASSGFRREAFYPCYGLAEGTLLVTGGDKGAAPLVSSDADGPPLVGCGRSVGGQDILLVDPELRQVKAEGEVGEIWVQGPSVARGYWNKPEETREVFQATLADGKTGPYLRTGDLGFFKKDELFVTGRCKDLIIINGVNHYPQDIELKLENHFPELHSGAGAAFSIHEDGEERLVVVWEMGQERDASWVEQIVRVLSEELDLSLSAVQFLESKTLPKTSSGKVSRTACREGFLKGTLKVKWQWRSKGFSVVSGGGEQRSPQTPPALPEEFKIYTHREIQHFLQEKISQHLGIPLDQIDPAKPFGGFGLDSKAALGIAGDLEVFLGKSLPITLMWQYPTIEKLSLHLTGEDQKGKIAYLPKSKGVSEPIAVVGMSCRFPKAKNPESFWQLLRDGVHAITEVPKDRWEIDEFYDVDPEAPSKMVTKWGGFLENLDQFDAEFFGISPKEAKKMDPQQRLVLELAWEALEYAGISPQSVAGNRGGVFLGIAGTDYSTEQMNDPLTVNAYAGTGNAHSIAANRLSYFLDLHGPSVALDTACSSSMVAIHLAVQSLRSGETDLALAGGVNMILRPEVTIVFSKARMMSPKGRCATFDAEADGYVRGEGCGMLVLKRLSDALKDGDSIQAIIRGSAVNQDGRSSSLTAPNGLAQQAVIREALQDGGLSAGDITYIEAHGTGTPIGDPIEMNSLGEVLQDSHSMERPCLVGSVKTNIGHLEVASGVAGMIKVILAMQHREIPPHLHLKKINEYIPMDRLPLKIPTSRTPWVTDGAPRRAGVNSFGFGGANAHIILEEAPTSSATVETHADEYHLFKLSAVNEESLKDIAQRYQGYLENHSAVSLRDLCFTANYGRGDFEYRLALVAKSTEQIQKSLSEIGRGEGAPSHKIRRVKQKQKPQIGFLFTGQGSQYPDMGKRLYQTQGVFRRAIDECDTLLREHRGFSLLQLLFPKNAEEEGAIHETGYTQPALYALEHALARLWESWGIKPDFVMGHSVGEYVAAAVAGVFSWQEGLLLIAERAALMQGLSKDGGMLAVLGEPEVVEPLLLPYQRDLSIAAINGPKNVVVSGKARALQALDKEFQGRGLATQALVVSHAFHSPMMDPILETFEKRAAEISFRSPRLPLVSNLKGRFFDPGEIPDAKYWTQHLRGTVRFLDGMVALAEQGCDVFLELGPQPVLTQLGKRCVSDNKISWLPSLKRGAEDDKVIQDSLGGLYLAGAKVLWEGLYAEKKGKRLNLPTYSFHKESYWLENPQERTNPLHRGTSKNGGPVIHPLLGSKIQTPMDQLVIFEHQILLDAVPYLRDHRVENEIIFPAAGYVDLALKAAQEYFGKNEVSLEELIIQQALFLEEKIPLRLQVTLEREIGSQCAFKVFSQSKGGAWTMHASGRVSLSESAGGAPRLIKDALDEIQARCEGEVEVGDFYRGLKFQGLNYGAHFQGVQKLWKGRGEALGRICLAKDLPRREQYCFHPALLDAALQVLAGVHADEAALVEKQQIYLPVEFSKVRFSSPIPEVFWSHGSFTERAGSKNAYGHIRFLDSDGRLVGEVEEVVFKPLPGNMRKAQGEKAQEKWLYRVQWEEKPRHEMKESPLAGPGTWVLFDEGGDLAEGLSSSLEAQGGRVLRVAPGEYFSNSAEGRFTLRPGSLEDYEKFLEMSFGQTVPACKGIVHLWGIDAILPGDDFLKNFEKVQDLTCHSVLHLIQALGKNPKWMQTRLLLITRGAERPAGQGGSLNLSAAPLWGLGKVIALENPEMQCSRIDLSLIPDPQEVNEVLQEVLYGDGEDQVALREGRRWVSRLVDDEVEAKTSKKSEKGKAHPKLQTPTQGAYRVGIHKAGTLDSVEIVPCERKSELSPNEIELEVRAAGLNFSDVLKALGLYPGLSEGPVPLGIECSGRVTRVGSEVSKYKIGDDVITVAPFCFGKYVVSLADDAMPKPPQISYEEAATIPVAFLTAYYALVYLGRIQKGERVLIHAGAGGVGLAAIQIAKLYDCEIFSTAGSPEKRNYLQELGVQHVMDSRSLKFADEIRKITKGKGVDIVLNSLAGDFIPASLAALGSYGRFLEIGKIDIYTNSKLGLLPFQDNLSYFAIDLDRLFRQRPAQARALFAELIQLFMEGKLTPLPHTDFPLSDLTQAFRYMAQRKNTGKVVVQTPVHSEPEEGSLEESGILSGQKTYLVTGGMGSLGLRVAKYLADHGAKHLALLSRRGRTADVEPLLTEIESAGAQVHVLSADVAQFNELATVLKKMQKECPPLGGVIHAAGLLEDGILFQQDRARFQKVMAPKAVGAMNLHLLTKDLSLDFFILFSSIASVLGSPGQGNYTAANAFLDALAQYRRGLGLPALSINWGPWGGGGMAANLIGSQDFAKRGLKAISTEKGLEILGALLHSPEAQQVVVSSDWDLLGQAYPKNRVPSLLASLYQPEIQGKKGGGSAELIQLMAQFKSLPPAERQQWLEQMIQKRVADALDTDPERVDPEKPLNTMGLDSLMALELKNEIENVLGVVIPITLLIKGPSLRELSQYVVNDLEALAS
jgi:myxalamid-type polyketide synthase MxaB